MIIASNAILNEWAVMVKFDNTSVAIMAMFAANWANKLTLFAEIWRAIFGIDYDVLVPFFQKFEFRVYV